MSLNLTGIKDNVTATPNGVSLPVATADSMKNAFIASGILHAAIFIVSLIGIPFLAKDEPLIITPVSIELVDIADISQTDRRAPPKKEDKPKEIEKPEPPKPVEAAPKVTSEAPPKLEELKPEEPKPKTEKKVLLVIPK